MNFIQWKDVNMINKNLSIFPTPKSVVDNGVLEIGNIASLNWSVKTDVGSGDVLNEAIKYIKDIFSKCFATLHESNEKNCFEIKLVNDNSLKKEAYKISVNNSGVTISSGSEAGFLYGAYTLKSLFLIDNNIVYAHLCEIFDEPSLENRGYFQESRFGSEFLTYNDWEKIIDYFSLLKMNELTISVYGCWDAQYEQNVAEYVYLPLKNCPEVKTYHSIKYYSTKNDEWVIKENLLPTMYTDDYFGKIIAYAKKKNIAIKPLFNSLGHNSVIPRVYPEISAIDENGNHKGFGICVNNPKTYERMYKIYDEIIDRYLLPNGIKSIHIGMDEVVDVFNIDKNNIKEAVSPKCHCKACTAREQKENIEDYVINICKYLKSRGIENIQIYHDMLFGTDITGTSFMERVQQEKLDDVVVIDWWSYGCGETYFGGNKENISSNLRSIIKPMAGYFAWSVPVSHNNNVKEAAELAYRRKCEGMEAYGEFEYSNDYVMNFLSEACWNANDVSLLDDFGEKYALRNFDSDAIDNIKSIIDMMTGDTRMNFMRSFFDYYMYGYLRPEHDVPRRYPAEAFERINGEKDKYTSYFCDVYSKSSKAYNYFSKHWNKNIGKVWELISMQYMTISSEYLTLLNMEKDYNANLISSKSVSNILGDLICKRENFMALAEEVRIPATSYTFLRNATITRQFLIDFKKYIDECISNGNEPIIDLTKPAYEFSDVFYKLR